MMGGKRIIDVLGATLRRRVRGPLRSAHVLLLIVLASMFVASMFVASTRAAGGAVRVEATSADLLVVGLVQGERMSIRVSRVLDNAPVHDAVIDVVLRGTTHPTVAQADGSYALTASDLTLPGDAAVQFKVTQGQEHETLEGVLKTAAAAAPPEDRGSARQMWWWALNFGVCIGFLWLFSRRKKRAQE